MRTWGPPFAICLGAFMLLIDITVVNVAMPSIAVDLGASFSDLQWVVDIYTLALAALHGPGPFHSTATPTIGDWNHDLALTYRRAG